jgi:uncharacterized membrane protein YdjX (TVP38/TMEM64 family)
MHDDIAELVASSATPPEGVTGPRILAACAGLAILIGGLIGARMLPGAAVAHFESVLGRIRDLGPEGIVLLAFIQVGIAVSGFVPGSLIGILAGTVYGVAEGFSLAAFSTMTGGLLAFLFARSVFRPLAARFVAQRAGRLRDFDASLAREGWRIVCLLRMCPIMPFAATSYALGATSVSLRDYLMGTLASLPALLGYVVIGALANAQLVVAAKRAGMIESLLIWGGLIATGILTWRIGSLVAGSGLFSEAPRRERMTG